jgi:hypothetical protein
MQDGRIHIEKINAPFLKEGGSPATSTCVVSHELSTGSQGCFRGLSSRRP